MPLLPAVAIGIALAVVRRPVPVMLVVWLSCVSVLVSFAISGAAFVQLITLPEEHVMIVDTLYTWVGAGVGSSAFSADLAFRFDALSSVMCFVVTGVGLLIHVYSVGYMASDERDDGGQQRFFCYLNLFTASMLVLVLADNLLLLFLGWEGVGLCSYLLIGFWYSDSQNAYAGNKAFLVNRIGDFGFLVGILLLFWSLADAGTPAVSFRAIEAGFGAIATQTLVLPAWLGGAEWGLPTVIGLCLFAGAVGKSAQLPLYGWLPDAMAGPTPVSALIHAATMVTAGVYMIARLSFLFEAAPGALEVIAWTGGLTAIFGATLALVQTDVKKVLAYSTVSQLGYMFLALGCGAYAVAIFHLVTHAFFKALLFLGAGVVIVAAHHEQDLRNLGGLRDRLPRTYWVMLAGALALSGIPAFSGFFSKDEILVAVYGSQNLPGRDILYWIGLVTAGLTAFYMARFFLLIFHGPLRVPREHRATLLDPGVLMMWPLYILALLAVFGGVFGVPQFWGDLVGVEESDSLSHFLEAVVATSEPHVLDAATVGRLVFATTFFSATGLLAAFYLYSVRPELAERLGRMLAIPRRVLERGYWVEEFFDLTLVRPLVWLSDRVLFQRVEVKLIDGGLVEGIGLAVRGLAANGLKYVQSGLAQSYLVMMVAGAVLVLVYLVGD